MAITTGLSIMKDPVLSIQSTLLKSFNWILHATTTQTIITIFYDSQLPWSFFFISSVSRFVKDNTKALEKVAQRGGGCLIPEDIEDQAAWGWAILSSFRSLCSLQRSWTRWRFRGLSTQMVLFWDREGLGVESKEGNEGLVMISPMQ